MTSISNFNCSKVDLSVAGKIAKNEPSSSGTNNQEDTDEEEREIEVLLQKTNFSFFHSKSAHANLSQMANKMEKISQRDIDEDEDSDEEFFVHQALLPLRKSKTSEFGAASSAQLANKSTRYYLETMAEMQKSFKSTYPAFQNTLPPEQLQKQINKNDSSQCSSSSNSSGSSSPAVPGCWSAPPVFSDHNSSNCSSGSHPSNDSLVDNECDDSKLFFLDEELKDKKRTDNKIPFQEALKNHHDHQQEYEQRNRSGTSWSSPSRLCAKHNTKSEQINTKFVATGDMEKIVAQNLEWFGQEFVVDNRLEVEEKENDSVEVYESAEKMEEKMSTSSEDEASQEEMLSRGSSPEHENALESICENGTAFPQSTSFKSSSKRIFIAPEYSGPHQVPTYHYTNATRFPYSKSDSQLIWYHAPVGRRLSRPRTPKFNESLNSLDDEDIENPESDCRQPFPHSATYCMGSGPRYHREWNFQFRNESGRVENADTAKVQQRLSMPLPSNQLQNGLAEEEELNYSEQEEEESLETDPQPGYSMAPHKWEIKWRKRAEEKINEGLGGKQASTSINYHPQQSEEVVPAAENGISMKKKRSSFALDEVVGASIPMADDLTAITSHISSPQQCPQVYYRSSSSCSSSTSQYDNHNYYNVAQEISEADKYQGKNRYISRRSAPLACDDDLLSDSEISDLEKKVARGDFSSPVTYEEAELKAEEYGLQTQQNSEHAAYSTANTTSGFCRPTSNNQLQTAISNISGSASMPCFSSTAIQTEHLQNIWLDCVEEKEKALVNQTKHPSAMLRSATMTSSNTNRCKPINQFESKWMPPQRRMLPLRPDEVVREKLQIATSEPQKLATLKQEAKPKPSRRLPQIPPQPFLTNYPPAASELDQLAEFPIRTNNSHTISLLKSSGIQNLVQRPRTMTTLQEDMTLGDTLKQPEKAENTAQTPMLVSSSTLANLLPQKAYSKASGGYGFDSREYQLSYGVETSMMSTSTAVEANRATNKYGIMEDSYYEDGLNGNTPLEDRDLLLNANRQINEVNRKNSGYNLAEENSSGISSCCTSSSTNADNPTNRGVAGIVTVTAKHSNGPTHRVQFPFSPRHPEEIALEVGDAVKVERECEDHWCYGTNLRTTHHGIFPAAHVCEIDLVEEICQGIFQANVQVPLKQDRDTFYLTMLASVEVGHHKGNDVLVQAINKICSVYQQKDEILIPQTILMEVSFRGIHVIDKRRKDFFRCPTFDFFFSLQNISFCGAHPKQLRYFGFITKHPLLPRFACHVFLSQESTQPIVEAIGRAFKRSYDEYMAFAHPTEDIFIE